VCSLTAELDRVGSGAASSEQAVRTSSGGGLAMIPPDTGTAGHQRGDRITSHPAAAAAAAAGVHHRRHHDDWDSETLTTAPAIIRDAVQVQVR